MSRLFMNYCLRDYSTNVHLMHIRQGNFSANGPDAILSNTQYILFVPLLI